MNPIWGSKSYLLWKQALYILCSQAKQQQWVKLTLKYWNLAKAAHVRNYIRLSDVSTSPKKSFPQHKWTWFHIFSFLLLICYSYICVKERAGWCETAERQAHSSQSASLHFSRALHFSLGYLFQTWIHAHTLRSITSKPYYTETVLHCHSIGKNTGWFWMERTRVHTPIWL